MVKYTKKVSSILFMRAGKTEEIMDGYKNNYLKFGCPANWINYALKCANDTIGDVCECVFANVKDNDPRINSLTDKYGKPMGDHLLILNNEKTHTSLLRYVPIILRPTMCFYSFKYELLYNEYKIRQLRDEQYLEFYLDEYLEFIGLNEENTSFLFITNTDGFIQDLKKAVPKAVENNRKNLTSKRFYEEFVSHKPIAVDYINYHKHKRNELFFDNPDSEEVSFWKFPEYEDQSEIRFVIPRINFKQDINNNMDGYDYKQNELNVYLPNFKSYAQVFLAKEVYSLLFNNFYKDKNDLGCFDLKIIPKTL